MIPRLRLRTQVTAFFIPAALAKEIAQRMQHVKSTHGVRIAYVPYAEMENHPDAEKTFVESVPKLLQLSTALWKHGFACSFFDNFYLVIKLPSSALTKTGKATVPSGSDPQNILGFIRDVAVKSMGKGLTGLDFQEIVEAFSGPKVGPANFLKISGKINTVLWKKFGLVLIQEGTQAFPYYTYAKGNKPASSVFTNLLGGDLGSADPVETVPETKKYAADGEGPVVKMSPDIKMPPKSAAFQATLDKLKKFGVEYKKGQVNVSKEIFNEKVMKAVNLDDIIIPVAPIKKKNINYSDSYSQSLYNQNLKAYSLDEIIKKTDPILLKADLDKALFKDSSNEGLAVKLKHSIAKNENQPLQVFFTSMNIKQSKEMKAALESLSVFVDPNAPNIEKLAYDIVNSSVASWADSATSRISLYYHEYLKMKFNLDIGAKSYYEKKYKFEAKAMWDNPALAQVVGITADEIYEKTQTHLRELGLKGVYLVRGVHNVTFDDYAVGHQEFYLNPLSSFTTNVSIALSFSHVYEDSLLLARWFPAEEIFSTPYTGFGCFNESEFVVLGGMKNFYCIAPFRVKNNNTPEWNGKKWKELGKWKIEDIQFMEKSKFESAAVTANTKPEDVENIDDKIENADWPKQSFDLGNLDSPQFAEWLKANKMTLEQFKKTPTYKAAFGNA